MPSIPDADAVEIVARLFERTVNDALDWSRFDQYEFKADSHNFMYFIKSRDEDDSAPFILEIWRRSDSEDVPATKLEEISTGDPITVNTRLSALYRAAKIHALGINNLKADILNDLGQ